jgi:hypothetical protein
MASDPGPEDYTEVYRAASTIGAQKILDTLFVPEGIHALVHDRADQMLPGTGQPGGYYLAVAAPHRERALAVLRDAQDNGFLDGEDGELL